MLVFTKFKSDDVKETEVIRMKDQDQLSIIVLNFSVENRTEYEQDDFANSQSKKM